MKLNEGNYRPPRAIVVGAEQECHDNGKERE